MRIGTADTDTHRFPPWSGTLIDAHEGIGEQEDGSTVPVLVIDFYNEYGTKRRLVLKRDK